MAVTTVYGLGVASDRVRIVAVARRKVVWAREVERVAGQSIQQAVIALISSAPLRRLPKPRVNVAIGPAASQLRYVEGLPPITDARVIGEIVQRGVARFLFQRGGPTVITGVRVTKPGAAWVGTVDETLAREVVGACGAAGIIVNLVLPAVAAVWRGAAGNHVVWRDGDIVAELRLTEQGLEHSRRRSVRGSGEEPLRPVPVAELASLGDAAWAYADAYGAAVVRHESFALPGRALAGRPRTPSRRLTLAFTTCIVCLASAAFLPTIVVARSATRAAARVSQLGKARRETARLQQDHVVLAEALTEVSAFASSRRSPTLLLAALADELPEDAVLVAFQLDSTGGSIVGAGPRASEIMNALERVPGIVSPQIAGAITREVVGSQELERVNVRFSLAAPNDSVGARRETRARTADHTARP